MTNGLRSKLLRAFFVVIAIFAIPNMAMLASYFVLVGSYQKISENIVSEYRLTRATNDIVSAYNVYFKQPNRTNRSLYSAKKDEVFALIKRLDTIVTNRNSASQYEGLKNTIYSVIEKTDAAIVSLDQGDIIGTTALQNEASRRYSFAEANATTLIMSELSYAQTLQSQAERLYFAITIGIVLALIIVIISSIIYSIRFAKKITGPLIKLTELAKNITKGNLKLNVDKRLIDKETEIGVLADSFNKMLQNLRKNINNLNQANVTLETKNKELDELNDILTGLKLKTEFLRIINHQLRTPVSALRGYLEFWRNGRIDKFTPEKQSEIRQNILIASDQLSSIINGMVDALELEAEGKEVKLDLSDINLKALVSDIYAADFKDKMDQKKITFELIADKIPEIRSDKKYLESIISNLIDNAIRYTNKGKISVSLSFADKNVILEVRDTGIGLNEEDKARLFQKFTRSEEAVKLAPGGSGLGLYIAKRMVDSLKGNIEVKSEGRGKGTVFIVRLPIL